MIKSKPSNRVLVNGKLINTPDGISVTNTIDDLELSFISEPRKKKLKHIVIHETAGRTAEGCQKTLDKKGYGIHFVLDRNGSLSSHADLVLDKVIHANQLNHTSIGIEIVNPYAPSIGKGMDINIIPAQWWTWCKDGDRRYVTPTMEQLNTLEILIPWLCDTLDIPLAFPTAHLSRKKRKITGWKKPPHGWRAKPKPGIVAHRDFATHADGRYPLEYLMTALSDDTEEFWVPEVYED